MAADFELRKDASGEWHGTFQANNNKTICRSTDGYKNRVDCIDSIKIVRALSPKVSVWDMTKNPIEKVEV